MDKIFDNRKICYTLNPNNNVNYPTYTKIKVHRFDG